MTSVNALFVKGFRAFDAVKMPDPIISLMRVVSLRMSLAVKKSRSSLVTGRLFPSASFRGWCGRENNTAAKSLTASPNGLFVQKPRPYRKSAAKGTFRAKLIRLGVVGEMNNAKCTYIETENILPGWGCCQCSNYNGAWRTECRACGHELCSELPADKVAESTATAAEQQGLLRRVIPMKEK